jgi:uncharacterized protein YdhG (YjbR/CyaY superfamily)
VDQLHGNDAVRSFIASIPPEHRPFFDRLQHLVEDRHPEAALVLSYGMPTYNVGKRRLYVGVWKHGLSIYGWKQGREAAFTSKHPETRSSKGTIRLRPADSVGISDEELDGLIRAALDD